MPKRLGQPGPGQKGEVEVGWPGKAKSFNNSHTFQVVTDRMTAQAGATNGGMPRPADNTPPNAASLHSCHGALGQVVCLALAAAYDSLSLSLSHTCAMALAISLCQLLCI